MPSGVPPPGDRMPDPARVRPGSMALLAVSVVLTIAGCSHGAAAGSSPRGGIATEQASTRRPLAPEAQRSCDAARTAINRRTAQFDSEVNLEARAAEQQDSAAQSVHLRRIRDGFTAWSTDLATLASRTADPAVRSMLTEYAGAVLAVRARARTVADLDRLATFDDIELDLAADDFARTC